MEFYLEASSNYDSLFTDEVKKRIKKIIDTYETNKLLGKLNECSKNTEDYKQVENDFRKEYEKICRYDKIEYDFITQWASLYQFSANSSQDYGDVLWDSRVTYYETINALHTLDLDVKITYLLNEAVQSVKRLWDYNNDRFKKIDGTQLDDISHNAYQEMEIALSSIKSNINKMIPMVFGEKELMPYKDCLGDNYKRILTEVDTTKFYLEFYLKMTENLLSQIHTESYIQEINTTTSMNRTLEKFTRRSLIMLIPMFVVSYLGINMFIDNFWVWVSLFVICGISFIFVARYILDKTLKESILDLIENYKQSKKRKKN